MNAERWKQIDELFDACLEIAPTMRSVFLKQKCGGDENLRLRVEKLLASMDESEDFLEAPQLESAFRLLGEDAAENLVGRQIGVYRLIRHIGQGGMGSVFLASRIDREFRQEVAIKIVSSLWQSAEMKNNFRRERQILARLEHANIARLLDGGTTDEGIPYLVMEYVEGLPVTKFCEEKNFSVKEKLLLFLKICEAVKFAHQNLIVHRDLKPANILINERGEPKLLDFGVAKLLNPATFDASENFSVGSNILTPNYASPEQLKNENITTATDVYSLGILLYELFTGKRPHDLKDKSLPEVLRIIEEDEPVLPSQTLAESKDGNQNPSNKDQKLKLQSLKGDLDTIVLKALAKEPGERYQTVEAFCDDITRYLNNLPIKARKTSAIYRLKKFTLRHKIGAAAVVSILLLLFGWLATAIYVVRTSRAQASENLRRAYSSDMNLAMQSYETANLSRLNQILKRYDETVLRGWEWNFLQNLANPKGKILTFKYSADVWRVAFSPDSKRLATAVGDGFARIYEVPGGKLLATTAVREKDMWRLKFSPDGRRLATASGDSNSTSARVWNAETGVEIFSLVGHTARVRAIDFSPDGKLLATGSRDGSIRLWNAETGAELKRFAVEKAGSPLETHDLEFTPDGKQLVTATSVGALILDVSSGRNLFNFDEDNSFAVAVSPDGTRFALGGRKSAVQIYDLKSGALLLEIKQHTAKINDLAFSPDGKLLASASSDRTVRFFETGKGTEAQNLRVHFEDAWSVAFSPDGKFIASAGTDFNAFLFDAAQILESSSFGISSGVSGWSVIAPDGKTMATSHFANPNETTIFDIETKSPKLVFSNEEVYAGAFSPDGAILATGMVNGEIVFRNSANGAEIRRFAAHKKVSTYIPTIEFLRFSPDGKLLVSGGADNYVKVWNTETAELIRVLHRFENQVRALAISPDGRRVFAAGVDRTAKLFDLPTGEILADLGEQRKAIMSAEYAPDGKTFVTGGADGVIKIWSAADGKPLDTLTGNAGFIQALAFTPDGKRLASASGEGVIRLWDTETKAEVLAIRTNSANTRFLGFTPDGNTLVSLGTQERIRLWKAAPVEK